MGKEVNPPAPTPVPGGKKRLVLCPECSAEVDLDEVDECPKCGLDVEAVYRRHRYNKALKKLEDAEKEETKPPKKKKVIGGFHPFED